MVGVGADPRVHDQLCVERDSEQDRGICMSGVTELWDKATELACEMF